LGSGILIVARCGSKPPVSTTSDVNGDYALEADVTGCNPLVVEYTKESFLPNLRVIPLPPPSSPLALDVRLGDLYRINCGSTECKTDEPGYDSSRADFEPAVRGWYASATGNAATDLLAGEMKDATGSPIILFGFSYMEAFDAAGIPVEKFTRSPSVIVRLATDEERLNVGDVDPTTTDRVEMSWYALDKARGRWNASPTDALLYYQWPCQPGQPDPPADRFPIRQFVAAGQDPIVFVRARQSEIPDITAGTLQVACGDPPMPTPATTLAIIGDNASTGWHAWGIAAPNKSCFTLSAKDSCGRNVAGASIVARGRFQPLRHETWTGADGSACIETVRSEPMCTDITHVTEACDYNFNLIGGEQFWLNIEVSHPELGPLKTFENQTIPVKGGSCAKPDTCVHLEHTFDAVCTSR
jgi:hypothetical protein